jgi:hypothetical protein
MKPTSSQVHVNRPLTNISIAFIQQANMFAAGQVFPMVPVESKSDLYFIYDKADMHRNDIRPRAPGTESAGSGFGINTDNYSCQVYSLHKDIDDQIRANADDPLDLDTAATQFLIGQSLIQREVTFAQKFMAQSVWSLDYEGVASGPTGSQVLKWTNSASDPVAQIKAATSAIHKLTGFRPNTLTLAQDVRDALDTNPSIIDRLKYGQTSPGAVVVTDADLARVFGVARIVVSGAVINNAKEGAAASNDFVIKGGALLTYSATTPSLMAPSAGYVFSWRGLLGNNEGVRVKRFRMEHLNSDRVELDLAYDQKKVSADLGAYFRTLV